MAGQSGPLSQLTSWPLAAISGPAVRTVTSCTPDGLKAMQHPLWDRWYRRGLMIHNRDREKAEAFALACHLLMNGKDR